MEKKMENEMETKIIWGIIGIIALKFDMTGVTMAWHCHGSLTSTPNYSTRNHFKVSAVQPKIVC